MTKASLDIGPDEPRYPLLRWLDVLDHWVLNTYVNCDIRCRYCITAQQYGESFPCVPRAEVTARLHGELDVIEHHIGLPAQLVVGSFSDVYQNVEAHHGVTRLALQVLVERDLPFQLVTKGATVLRDIDLFASFAGANVQISLCSVEDDKVAHLDPAAPSATERLSIIHTLAAAGVPVRVQASPWIPGVSDVTALLDRLDPAIQVTVTPLRITTYVEHFAAGLRLTQATVNEAYRREHDRVTPRRGLLWSQPPALDGAPPHIYYNIGRPFIESWAPAPGCYFER